DVGAAARAFEHQSALPEFRERGVVEMDAVGLTYDVAVPIQSVSPQCLQNFFRRSGHDARRVEILDPHEPPPSRRPREKPRADGRDQAAEMQRSGRRRSKSACQRGSEPWICFARTRCLSTIFRNSVNCSLTTFFFALGINFVSIIVRKD